MKPRRSGRSKSVPLDQPHSPKKSFLTTIRRFSINAILRPNSHRLPDEESHQTRPGQPKIPSLKPDSRISRRASRFWSISPANHFEDNTPAQSSSPTNYEGTAYVPRHAAADFSKTASNRLTVMVEADETTLCSYNCDDEQQLRQQEDASHHRQEALAALTARARSRSVATTATTSEESLRDSWRQGSSEYTVFMEQAADDPQDARARRSAAAWAELEHRARRPSGSDPLIGRNSRGGQGVRGSVSGSSRPVSSIAISIAEYIRPSQVGRAW